MLTLLSTGSNAQGQLGHGTIEDSNVFIPCSFANCPSGTLPKSTSSILNVVTGSNHTLILLEFQHKTNNSTTTRTTEVWGSGDGSKGQLGPDFLQHQMYQNQSNSTIFQKLSLEVTLEKLGLGLESGYTISDIGTTWETSYVVLHHHTKHDTILSFGSDDFGDLGVGKLSNKNKNLGLQVVDYSSITIDGKLLRDASIATVEKLRTGQRHIIVSLSASWKNDNEPSQILIGWGACRHGQLDTPASNPSPPSTQPIVKPAPNKTKPKSKTNQAKTKSQTAPTFHSLPILLIYTSNPEDIIIEYSLGIQHSVFLHKSGRISYRGSNRKQQLEGLNNLQLQPIHDVKCTWNGTYIITGNEPTNILSTGSNTHGQLGRSELDPTTPVMSITKSKIKSMTCGSEHILVVITNESGEEEVWGWGWNEHGNLGIGNTRDSPSAVRIISRKDLPRNNIGSHDLIYGVWGGTGTSWILRGSSET